MVEAALPKLSFSSYHHPIIDFTQELPDCRPATPDSQLENDDDAVILQAQTAMRPVTQRLIDLHPPSSLKIITTNYSLHPSIPSSLLSATTASEGIQPVTHEFVVPFNSTILCRFSYDPTVDARYLKHPSNAFPR